MDLKAGGVYSINNGNGEYGIAKVLLVKDDLVHIKLYNNTFSKRPKDIDKSILFKDENVEIAQMSILKHHFLNWDIEHIKDVPLFDCQL